MKATTSLETATKSPAPSRTKYQYFSLRGNSQQRGQQASAIFGVYPKGTKIERGSRKNGRVYADKPSSETRGTVIRVAVAK